MRQPIHLLLCLAVLSVAALGDDKDKPTTRKATPELTDPVEILKKADAASKAVKTAKYDIVVEPKGVAESFVGRTKATVTATGVTSGGPEQYLVDAKVAPPGSGETVHITGGGDGDTFFLIRHADKIAHVDIDPAVLGSFARPIMGNIMLEFFVTEPFTQEINGKSHKLAGSRTIGGEDCYEIHVVYDAERAPETTWFLSKKDFLPRCRLDKFSLPDGRKGEMRRTITNLDVGPKLDKDTFKLKLPQGYTKTDEFAP